MQQRIIQIGNSIGVVIPTELRRQNNINKGTKVSFKQAKDGILIQPVKKQLIGDVDVKFAKMVDEFITEHEDVLKELAQR